MQMDVDSDSSIESTPSVSEQRANIIANATLDLDNYIQSYEGYMRYLRLAFIARNCPPLTLEALRQAIQYVYTETEDYPNYLLLNLWYQRVLRNPLANVDDLFSDNIRLTHASVILNEHPRNQVLENMQQEIIRLISELPQPGPDPPNENYNFFDAAWVSSVRQRVSTRVDELEAEMKAAKILPSKSTGSSNHPSLLYSTSNKKSYRIPALKLAQLYARCGDLYHAIRCYSQAEEQSSSSQEELEILQELLYVATCYNSWTFVDTYLSRMESRDEMKEFRYYLNQFDQNISGSENIPGMTSNDSFLSSTAVGKTAPAHETRAEGRLGYLNRNSNSQAPASLMERESNARIGMKMLAVTGLSEMNARKYKAAARSFLQIRYELFEFNELINLGNVAQYGGLCALATFDRRELKKLVFENAVAKQVLEADPDVRDVLQTFYQAQYGQALNKLASIENNLRLDFYLSIHMNTLLREIRSKAIHQYFSPYLSCDLLKTASEFNMPVQALEDELSQMILDEKLNARIDSQSKMLYSKSVDQRKATYESVLRLCEEYRRSGHAFLMRNALKRRGIMLQEATMSETNVGVSKRSIE